MVKKLSRYFRISAAKLSKAGVFDAFIGIDNQLFVDPTLLRRAKTPEFQNARAKLERYFADVIILLEASAHHRDAAWREAANRLVFSEEHGTALGYAGAGSHGTAIGPELGARLVERGSEIVKLGVKDPVIFELIGLFEDDFGADRLSDMTVAILREEFLLYTQRITLELNLKPSGKLIYRTKEYVFPLHPDGKSPLLLVPKELLDLLPVAVDRSEIDHVAEFNAELRQKFNQLFAAARKLKRPVTKADIRAVLFGTKNGIETLVRVYRNTAGKPYDFDDDPLGLFEWEDIGISCAKRYPLALAIKAPKTIAEVKSIVSNIIKQFKKNVEENRLYEVLYDNNDQPRKEVYSQRLFYAIADAYCEANDVDLNREPNAGNGPVDFKVSSGYKARVLVEIKLSSNTHLVKGFTEQLPAYEKSEQTQESILVILRVTESDTSIREVLRLRQEAVTAGKRVPEVYVIDARPTPAASRR
jgi:hypothetical protein